MKRKFKVLLILVFILVFINLILFLVDFTRAKNNKLPFFAKAKNNSVYMDGGTKVYKGIFYNVIVFNKIYTEKLEYKHYNGIHVFSKFENENDAYDRIWSEFEEQRYGKEYFRLTSEEQIIYEILLNYYEKEKIDELIKNKRISVDNSLSTDISNISSVTCVKISENSKLTEEEEEWYTLLLDTYNTKDLSEENHEIIYSYLRNFYVRNRDNFRTEELKEALLNMALEY